MPMKNSNPHLTMRHQEKSHPTPPGPSTRFPYEPSKRSTYWNTSWRVWS